MMKPLPYLSGTCATRRYPATELEMVDAEFGQRIYRVGHFFITRAKCRWCVHAHHVAPDGDFPTLGGAIVWCHQQTSTVESAVQK
jgi:hypothetical protein